MSWSRRAYLAGGGFTTEKFCDCCQIHAMRRKVRRAAVVSSDPQRELERDLVHVVVFGGGCCCRQTFLRDTTIVPIDNLEFGTRDLAVILGPHFSRVQRDYALAGQPRLR